jgi:hypothetical protein
MIIIIITMIIITILKYLIYSNLNGLEWIVSPGPRRGLIRE